MSTAIEPTSAAPCVPRRRLLAGALAGWGACLVGVALPGLLAGCASPRPVPERRDGPEFQRFVDRGYRAAEQYVIEEVLDSWSADGEEVAISLLVPRAEGRHPLLIYLPGLGESAKAGARWRHAWAAAGYAVLSVQRVASGDGVRNSGHARSGDFTSLAREQFAVTTLPARAAAVRMALAEATRRAAAGQSPYARIDVSRLALAGYDLGAQTAQFLAGELPRRVEPAPALPGLRSMLALSPYASIAAGDFADRFGGIHLPVLSVTGSEDIDTFGLVTSAVTRQAPFRYMAPGDKFLLALEGATHRALSGNGGAFPGDEAMAAGDGERPDFAGDRARGGPGGGMGRGPGGARGGMGGPGGGMGGPGGRMGGPGGRMGGPGGRMGGPGGRMGGPGGGMGDMGDMGGGPPGGPGGGGRPGMARGDSRRQGVCIEAVTTAFLDATVKGDPVAREWLEKNAAGWLELLALYQRR